MVSSSFSNDGRGDFSVFNIVILTFSLLSMIFSYLLMLLTREARLANVFNLCIHIISKLLFVSGILSIVLVAPGEVIQIDSNVDRPLHYFISILLIIRGSCSVVAVILNAIISFSIYALIIKNEYVNFKDKDSRIKLFFVVVAGVSPYIITSIIQEFNPVTKSNVINQMVSTSANNLVALISKLVFSSYSLYIFIYCEYHVAKRFPVTMANKDNVKFITIRSFMDKMMWLSLVQFISLFPIIICGITNNFVFDLGKSSEENDFFTIGQVFLLLNPAFLLLTYVQIDTDSSRRLKSIFRHSFLVLIYGGEEEGVGEGVDVDIKDVTILESSSGNPTDNYKNKCKKNDDTEQSSSVEFSSYRKSDYDYDSDNRSRSNSNNKGRASDSRDSASVHVPVVQPYNNSSTGIRSSSMSDGSGHSSLHLSHVVGHLSHLPSHLQPNTTTTTTTTNNTSSVPSSNRGGGDNGIQSLADSRGSDGDRERSLANSRVQSREREREREREKPMILFSGEEMLQEIKSGNSSSSSV